MKKRLSILPLILLFFGCSPDNTTKAYYPIFEKSIAIEGTAYKIENGYGCESMYYIDSMIVLFNTGDRILNFYDANNGKQLSSYGFLGRADNEYLSALNCGIDPTNKSTLVIQDITKAKISHIKISRFQDSLVFERVKHYDFNPLPMVAAPEFLKNGYKVGHIFHSSEYKDFLVLMDNNNNIKANFCNPLNLEIEDKNIMNGSIEHVDNKFVYACRNFGYLSLYSVDSLGTVNKEWDYLLKDVKYGNRNGQLKWSYEENHSGFFDVFMTKKYVIAIYSGMTDDNELPKTILVFDYEGNPIIKFTTSRDILFSALSDDGKKIYTYDGDETLITYDLSSYLN